ncbi:MAG: hypothetical protein WC069_07010 [Candidatus Shapirobacteria bacterium]
MVKIIELIHFGKISENGFAEIDIDVYFKKENKTFKNLKAFIDTGANRSAINEKYLEGKINTMDCVVNNVDSANGEYESKQIPDVGISLPMTNGKFIPLNIIGSIKLQKLNYDFIIGNDILLMCEFIYNGLSKTYVLKLFQTS